MGATEKLLSLLMIVSVAGTLMGTLAATAAFTTVEADRTADVSAAGDAGTLLVITPATDPANSSFIHQNETQDSIFEIDLTDTGVNANATTTAENLFNITNNGQEDLDVWINTEGGTQQENPDVNTTFYIDNTKTGTGADDTQIHDASGSGTADAVLIGDRITEFDTLVTTANSSRAADVVISESRTPENVGQSPQHTGIAVNIDPGQTVTVSLAIEIESDADADLESNEAVLNEITIVAVNDEDLDKSIQEGTETTDSDRNNGNGPPTNGEDDKSNSR